MRKAAPGQIDIGLAEGDRKTITEGLRLSWFPSPQGC